LPVTAVFGIKGGSLPRGMPVLAVRISRLLAEAPIALDPLDDHVLDPVQVPQAQDQRAATPEHHAFLLTVLANARRDPLRPRAQDLFDLPTLATATEGGTHGVHLDSRRVSVVRSPIIEEPHLRGVYAEELGDRPRCHAHLVEKILPF